jgi:hypothetical protein
MALVRVVFQGDEAVQGFPWTWLGGRTSRVSVRALLNYMETQREKVGSDAS